MWEIPPEQVEAGDRRQSPGSDLRLAGSHEGHDEQGFGQIYNMEGFGANGRTRDGMSIYGTSKAAVNYFNQALITEAQDTGIVVGTLSPGMVMTELVLERFKDDPEGLEKAKSIFNIIADTADDVAPWMVEQVLSNDRHGANIDYMPRSRMVGRFLKSPFSKRDLFAAGEDDEVT